MFDKAISILKKINMLGYKAYIVGGYPRDKYLNIESKDIDICTNAPLSVLENNFEIIKKNEQFKSLVIKDEYEFDITCFRKDYYSNSRYPKVVSVDTLKEDLLRRDFTINTLCIDETGNYVDFYNCISDIENKIIKTIENPDISLKNDPLRIIRAIRFSLILGFNIDASLKESIIRNSNLVEKINPNLINKEIEKMIEKFDYREIINEFKKYGLEVCLCKKN